jgi:hypothetical protein
MSDMLGLVPRQWVGGSTWLSHKENGMLRKVFCAVFVLTLCVGLAVAEELRGVITKVEGSKVSFKETKGKDDPGGPEKTLTAVENVKVVRGKFNKDTKKLEAGEAVAGGLKSEVFTKIGEKGVRATIVTDDKQKITEIRIFGGRKKD